MAISRVSWSPTSTGYESVLPALPSLLVPSHTASRGPHDHSVSNTVLDTPSPAGPSSLPGACCGPPTSGAAASAMADNSAEFAGGLATTSSAGIEAGVRSSDPVRPAQSTEVPERVQSRRLPYKELS